MEKIIEKTLQLKTIVNAEIDKRCRQGQPEDELLLEIDEQLEQLMDMLRENNKALFDKVVG